MSALRLVVSHPGFFRLERVHAGHTGTCPQEAWAGLPCWHWDVGVSLREGQVSWWHGATWEETVSKAADAIEEAGRRVRCTCVDGLCDLHLGKKRGA